jgi:hypothetical protein
MGIIVKHGVQLLLPEGWVDSSDQIGNSNRQFTLTRPDGVGAFQMSFAQYISGKLPDIQLHNLRDLLSEFAASRRLGPEQAQAVGEHNGVLWCRADYQRANDFIRVWYLSDSKSVVLATYICNWPDRHIEVQDCNRIVDSVEFISP